jgi:hypothetical protein
MGTLRGALRGTLWLRRLGWLAALWLGGVAALGLVAMLLRLLMHAAGMK